MKIEYNGKQLECISLALRRVFAEQILRGEKTIETRFDNSLISSIMSDKEAEARFMQILKNSKMSINKFNKLTDEQMNKWLSKLSDEDIQFFEQDNGGAKKVEAIHFYDRHAGKWELNVLVDENGFSSLLQREMEYLQNKYGFHDFDSDIDEAETKVANGEWNEDDVSCFYWFHISGIINSRGLERHIQDVNPDLQVNIS
jgi:hypothetical protein